jgi:hypothetical protein
MENYNQEVLDDECIEISDKLIQLHTVPQVRLLQMQKRYSNKVNSDDDLSNDGYYTAASRAIDKVIRYRELNPDSIKSGPDLLEGAKVAAVGDTVTCPQCKSKFDKKNTKHVFCSNAKSKSGGNCKDRYWNLNDPARKERLDNRHENFDA